MCGQLPNLSNLNKASLVINYTVIYELVELFYQHMLNGYSLQVNITRPSPVSWVFVYSFTQCRQWTFEPSQHVARKTGKSNTTIPKGRGLEKKVSLWSESVLFLRQGRGGKGNRISLWVKSWGPRREGIDRGWGTEKGATTYRILLHHILTQVHSYKPFMRKALLAFNSTNFCLLLWVFENCFLKSGLSRVFQDKCTSRG